MHFFSATDWSWRAGAKAEGVFALPVGFNFAILRLETVDVFAHGVE